MLGLQRPKVIREPRKALSAEQAERIRAELPAQADRVLWGLIYAAGLRTEEALALRWSDVRDLTPTGGSLAEAFKAAREKVARPGATPVRPRT